MNKLTLSLCACFFSYTFDASAVTEEQIKKAVTEEQIKNNIMEVTKKLQKNESEKEKIDRLKNELSKKINEYYIEIEKNKKKKTEYENKLDKAIDKERKNALSKKINEYYIEIEKNKKEKTEYENKLDEAIDEERKNTNDKRHLIDKQLKNLEDGKNTISYDFTKNVLRRLLIKSSDMPFRFKQRLISCILSTMSVPNRRLKDKVPALQELSQLRRDKVHVNEEGYFIIKNPPETLNKLIGETKFSDVGGVLTVNVVNDENNGRCLHVKFTTESKNKLDKTIDEERENVRKRENVRERK